MGQAVEPLIWLLKVAYVAAILIVALIRAQPPCDAEPISGRQNTENAEFQIADVVNIAVPHEPRWSLYELIGSFPRLSLPPAQNRRRYAIDHGDAIYCSAFVVSITPRWPGSRLGS